MHDVDLNSIFPPSTKIQLNGFGAGSEGKLGQINLREHNISSLDIINVNVYYPLV